MSLGFFFGNRCLGPYGQLGNLKYIQQEVKQAGLKPPSNIPQLAEWELKACRVETKALTMKLGSQHPLSTSTFATVRHRTKRSKGCLSRETAFTMTFKLIKNAEKTWRRLDGKNQLPKIVAGVKFSDGVEAIAQDERMAA